MRRVFCIVVLMFNIASYLCAEDFSFGGLSFTYPAEKYRIDNKKIGSTNSFSLYNSYATEPDFAVVSFNYGQNQVFGHNGNLQRFCKRRIAVARSYLMNRSSYTNFISQNTYIEDHSTYSIGIEAFDTKILGTPSLGHIIVAASSQNIIIIIIQGTKEDYIFEIEKILSTIKMPQIRGLRLDNLFSNYYAFLNKPMPAHGNQELCNGSNNSPKPLLELVPNSIKFVEQNNNQFIDANEYCKIQFQLKNNGKGTAINCVAKISVAGNIDGLSISNVKLPMLEVGTTQTIEIPMKADINTTDGVATFTIEVTEPNGYGIDPMTLTVNTKAFDAPLVKVVDYAVSGNGIIQKKQPFDLQLLLQNTKYGKAEDVDVTLSVPSGVSLWEGEEKTHYATINGGEQQKLNYQLAISGNYAETTVPIIISIKEKYGKFAENKTINLALNQQLASATSVTLQGQQPQVQREAIAIGVLGSAVDKNIPVSQTINKNTFVVIIANENYMSVASVPYALNDGIKFREYCQKTLGIPEKNIKYVANATGNQIKAQVQWLENITNVFDDPNIIFYYAGHGFPDESSKTAYLLPVDGIGTDVTTGYKLDDLYASLGKMPSAHTTIFLDACFSGSKREDGMLASARGVAIKAKSGVPQGNMVVFSAAQGDETAYPNSEEGHGMFTYFLLKKLQETSGDVTLLDLGNYITKSVSQQSILLNGKSQTPSVTAASGIGTDWQKWKLK